MDGVATPEEYAARAAKLGMPAIACTDHGSLSAHRRFYRACKDNGVKPILGMEGYITFDRFDRRDKAERTTPLDLVYNHIIILAQNAQGLENLNQLNQIAWTEGFYRKPRIDFDVLDKYGDGLIISSACMSGLLNKAIELEEFAAAKQNLKWFIDRFGRDNFYVEVMPHNIDGMNEKLFALANEFGVKTIVTPDCHHCTKDQKVVQEMMLILNTHTKVQKDSTYEKSTEFKNMMERLDYLYGKDRAMSFRSFDIHLLDYDEMRESMSKSIDNDSFYTNTLAIADMVEDYEIKRNLNLLPIKVDNPDNTLRKYAESWLQANNLHTNQEYVDRMNEELEIIKDKNFAPYFLVVHNMIDWAKSQGILVGPGRGSAAGSLVCYALGITEIDPIKYGLLFFRFINPDRNDFPDIDTDIQDSRREEVKHYLEKEYGNVASIATFLQFKDKGVVRDVARVLHVPLSDVNRVMKSTETWQDFTTSHSTKWFREKYPEVMQYAEKIRGRIRGTGIHAAGVVTSNEPIAKYAPMETRLPTGSKERIPVVAVDMEEAADIGLIKIDVLGLKTLTVIQDILKLIKERHHKTIDLHSILLDDKNVFKMLSDGYTKGVFQCEANPYTNLLIKMGVRNFDELVASNALVRPGAMNTIGRDYIARKNGKATIEYIHPVMKDALEDTYGCVLYQEQVMIACNRLGGMSMADADKVRKIIGKKKDAKEFDQFKNEFIKGASKYISPAQADHLWTDFEAHAGYSFNKSHAVAYSTLSYWTAWLKYHYPLEFIFAILNNENDKDARTGYLIEAKRMGIPVKLPHINESDIDFKIEGKSIRLGLASVKWISDGIASKIIERRPFKSYKEVKDFGFEKGSGVNTRAVEALNAIGGLTFDDNPKDEEKVRSNLYEYLNLPEFNVQIPNHYLAFVEDLEDFDEMKSHIFIAVAKKIKRAIGWSRIDFMDKTKMVGFFDEQETQIETGKTYLLLTASNRVARAIPIDKLDEYKDDPLIKFLNYKELPYEPDEYYVLTLRKNITKTGKKLAYVTAADYNRTLHPVVAFSAKFADAYMMCEPGKAVKMKIMIMKDGTTMLEEVSNAK